MKCPNTMWNMQVVSSRTLNINRRPHTDMEFDYYPRLIKLIDLVMNEKAKCKGFIEIKCYVRLLEWEA
jgi:hypothetical protein